jgi:hypothetical protein
MPLTLSPLTVIGHEDAQHTLAQLASHTLLFTGPHGVGKRTTARWHAARLNCSSTPAPCGQCPSCKLFLANEHPDYREISTRATTGKGHRSRNPIISIRQMVPRKENTKEENENVLSRWLEQRPRFKMRVGVIVDAHLLTQDAANTFLKILEEPPSYATIVLTAPSADAVLPTIVSRSTQVRFGALSPAELRHVSDGQFDHPLLHLGRASDVAAHAEQGDAVDALVKVVDDYVQALKGSLEEAFQQADALEKAWSNAEQTIAVPDVLRAALRPLGKTVHANALPLIDVCEDALSRYASPSLAVQVLTLELRRVVKNN